MNEQSSRSHSILMVTAEKHELTTGLRKTSALYLVDLAGSENAQRTGAERERLEEGKNINKSLQALKRVINCLVEKARMLPERAAKLHVPFRDSALTRVLQNAIAGSSRTRMIVCVSPDKDDLRETVSSLEFGQLTATIRNGVRENVHRSTEELQEELLEAQNTLLMLRETVLQLQRKAGRFSAREPRIPAAFLCPLTGQLLENPVVCENGHTYSRRAITSYYRQHGALPEAGNGRVQWTEDDPADGAAPMGLLLLPNYNLAEQITAWQSGRQPLRPRSLSTAYLPARHRYRVWVPVTRASELPQDCVTIICEYLEAAALHAMTRTCRVWQEVADQDSLWLRLTRQRFGVQTFNPLVSSAKEQFFRLMSAEARPAGARTTIPTAKSSGFALFKAH